MKPKKFQKPYNFFLNPAEKQLFFNLKKLYQLDRQCGSTDSYQNFIDNFNKFYEDILDNFSYENNKTTKNNE